MLAGIGPKVVIQILADASKAQKALKDTGSTAGQIGSGFQSALVPALAVLGVIGGIGAVTAGAASDTEQAFGALDSIFGDTSDQAKAMAKSASSDVGLASSAYAQTAAILAAQLGGMGIAADQLLPKTDELIRLGADLAATFGGTTADAVGAISALLRGERDPIERYGVSLKQTDIDARLAAMGIVTAKKAADDLAKAHKGTVKAQEDLAKARKAGDPAAIRAAQGHLDEAKAAEKAASKVDGLDTTQMKAATATASLALLTEQTAKAQGQFARESDTAAHATQVADAKMKDAASTIGTALLPVVVLLADAFAQVADWVGKNAPLVLALAAVIGTLAAAVVAVNIGIAVYQAAVAAATAAQWLWNVALDANPIGIIIIAVLALIAALVLLWQNSETFRNIVTGAFQAIQTVVGAVVGAVVGFFQGLVVSVRTIFAPVQALLSGPFNAFLALARSVFALVGAVVRLAVLALAAIWGAVTGILKGPFDALLAIARTVLGIVGGLFTTALTQTRTIFGAIGAALAKPFNDLLGVVRTVFAAIRGIVQRAADFITGIFDRIRSVVDKITGALNSIPKVSLPFMVPAPPSGVAGPSTFGTRAGTPVPSTRGSITLVLDGHTFGRATIDALRTYDRRNGPAQVIPRWS